VKLQFLGQSGFAIHTSDENQKDISLLIDPFLTGNPLIDLKAEDFSPDYIVLTHAHGDHYGDTEAIAKASGAKVISNFEIVNYVASKGIEGHPMNPGGSWDFDFGRLKFVQAFHSSSFPDGTYGGVAMGAILEIEGKRIYHAGDTALFSDMALFGRQELDLALLPIGDNFTMGIDDAVEAAKLLKAKAVVPIHYDTFGYIKQDPDKFKKAVETQTTSTCQIVQPGETITL